MSPLDLDLGVDLEIVDEPAPAVSPTATDTGFLIHSLAGSGSPTTVQKLLNPAQARTVFPAETNLIAAVDGFFGVGGGRLYVVPLDDDVQAALDLITAELGRGQISAPEVVAEADQALIRDFAWSTNRIYLADAPADSDESALSTLSDLLLSASGRNSGIWGDTVLIPGLAPGSTREIPSSIAVAGMIGRSDRATGNPNLAAAGKHTPGAAGQSNYLVGIKNPRPLAEIQRLARAQVNSFRMVDGAVTNYGYWTLADLELLPHWWDLSGSRTMMAIRAEEEGVAESMMFGQVAADNLFLDKYKGLLSGILARYQRIGAVYGTEQNPGYRVAVSSEINQLANVAQGKVKAQINVATSPFAADLGIAITRRSIVNAVA